MPIIQSALTSTTPLRMMCEARFLPYHVRDDTYTSVCNDVALIRFFACGTPGARKVKVVVRAGSNGGCKRPAHKCNDCENRCKLNYLEVRPTPPSSIHLIHPRSLPQTSALPDFQVSGATSTRRSRLLRLSDGVLGGRRRTRQCATAPPVLRQQTTEIFERLGLGNALPTPEDLVDQMPAMRRPGSRYREIPLSWDDH